MTRELGLWIFIAILALATRASNLELLPLTNAEATDALGVLRLVRGEAATVANPLFNGVQYHLFAVFEASNLLARLPAVLGGVLLCLTPVLARSQIRRGRALVLGLLMAFSPVLWLMGRTADGAILAWAIALAAWFSWQNRAGSTRLVWVCLGLLLACGRDAVPPLLCVVIAQVVNQRWGVGVNAPIDPSPSVRRNSSADYVALLLAFVLGATALWFNPSGLGSALNGITDWVDGITNPPAAPVLVNRLLSGLLLYEVLFIMLAVMGIVSAWLERDWHRELGWLVFIAVGLLLFLVNGSRTAASLAPIVIGCAALGARFIQFVFRQFQHSVENGTWPTEWTVMGLSSVLLMFAFLSLLQYAHQGQLAWLVSLVVAGLMIVGISLMFSVNGDVLAPVRGLIAAVGLCFALYTLGNGYQLNFVRADNPGEPYRTHVASSDLNDLVQQLHQISVRALGDPGAVPIRVDDKAPASLRWALRGQRFLSYGPPASDSQMLLTPMGTQPNEQRVYIGDAFTVNTSSNLGNTNCRQIGDKMDCTPLAKWLAFRQITDIKSEQWTLWLSQDVAALASGVR
ncbi:MAG: hypothetical protein KIH69_002785 [Anaerolineae bacterium]|nr:hypothetical protein [Anaerolineae bacterium]